MHKCKTTLLDKTKALGNSPIKEIHEANNITALEESDRVTDTRFVEGSILDQHQRKYRKNKKIIDKSYHDWEDLRRMATILKH